jgi:hypothetical protein
VTDSDAIVRVIRLLRALGARVHLYVFELPCLGMYRSETREAFLNASGARDALLTIAHEAGHHIGYLRRPMKHSYQRERQAFVFGWPVLLAIGADVTRAEWIAHERARRASPDVDTSHVLSL